MVDEARAVNRKRRVGVVVSDKSDRTIVVVVERATRHRLYNKVIRRTKKYHVHDPENSATMGDLVRIEECRPISKTKHWRLTAVLTEREVATVAPEAIDQTLVSDVQRTAARAAAEEAVDEAVEGDAPAAAEASTQEEPAAEAPAQEEPVAEASTQEEPVADAPAQEEPVAETPAQEEPGPDAGEGEQAPDDSSANERAKE